MPNSYPARKLRNKPLPIFREDNLYHLTLRQQAAVAFAFCSTLDRIADSKDREEKLENLGNKKEFESRYKDLFAKSGINLKAIISIVKNLRNYFSHYLHKPEIIRELKSNAEFLKFMELLHQEAKNIWKKHHDAWLERYSLPEEREEAASNLAAEINAFDWSFFTLPIKDGGFKEIQGKDCPVPFCDILLLLSMFISKGDMMRLLDKLPGMKQHKTESADSYAKIRGENTQAEDCSMDVRTKRELLTALCLNESHDLRSGDADIIAALTILDDFAKRMGVRKAHDGKPIHNTPKRFLTEDLPNHSRMKEKPESRASELGKLPEICRSYSKDFFIKMLVAVIEACGFLPGICIARARNGEPVFLQYVPETKKRKENAKAEEYVPPTSEQQQNWYKDGEVYLNGSNVAILIDDRKNRDGNPLTGSLSLNALKLIALKGMDIRKPNKEQKEQEKQYKECIVNPILDCFNEWQNIDNEKTYETTNRQFIVRLPDVFCKESQPKEKFDIKKAIEKRIDFLQQRARRICTDHQKALYIMWWLNRRLPEEYRLKTQADKDKYQNAVFVLTGIFNFDEFISYFQAVSAKQLRWQGKTDHNLKSALKAPDLKVMFNRVKSDFTWYIGENGPTHSNDDAELLHAAKVLGVRSVKEPHAGHSMEKARKNFRKRFERQLGPSPVYLFTQYFHGLKDMTNRKNNRLPVLKLIKQMRANDKSYCPDLSLYYYHDSADKKRRLPEKARMCLEHDSLLLFLAEKLLGSNTQKISDKNAQKVELILNDDFSYTAKMPVKIPGCGDFILVVDSAQARRSYVSQHKTRIGNVLKNYWLPFHECSSNKEIPFYQERTQDTPEAPQSWLEAEGRMNRERQILIQAIFRLEKETANSFAQKNGIGRANKTDLGVIIQALAPDENYVGTKALFEKCGIDCDKDQIKGMHKFRNWALHQTPEESFSKAPGRLGELFKETQEEIEAEREKKRKAGQRENSKKARK